MRLLQPLNEAPCVVIRWTITTSGQEKETYKISKPLTTVPRQRNHTQTAFASLREAMSFNCIREYLSSGKTQISAEVAINFVLLISFLRFVSLFATLLAYLRRPIGCKYAWAARFAFCFRISSFSYRFMDCIALFIEVRAQLQFWITGSVIAVVYTIACKPSEDEAHNVPEFTWIVTIDRMYGRIFNGTLIIFHHLHIDWLPVDHY